MNSRRNGSAARNNSAARNSSAARVRDGSGTALRKAGQ